MYDRQCDEIVRGCHEVGVIKNLRYREGLRRTNDPATDAEQFAQQTPQYQNELIVFKCLCSSVGYAFSIGFVVTSRRLFRNTVLSLVG